MVEGKPDESFLPFAMSTRFAKGDLILHPKFGKGLVLGVEGDAHRGPLPGRQEEARSRRASWSRLDAGARRPRPSPRPGPRRTSCSISSSATSRELGPRALPGAGGGDPRALRRAATSSSTRRRAAASRSSRWRCTSSRCARASAASTRARSRRSSTRSSSRSAATSAPTTSACMTGDAAVNRDAPHHLLHRRDPRRTWRCARARRATRRLRRHGRVPLLRRPRARRRLADPAPRPRARAVPPHERDARRPSASRRR